MNKQIRPLAAYKKANPKMYGFYTSSLHFDNIGGLSKKGQENEFYWRYAYLNLLDLNKYTMSDPPPPFFWKKYGKEKNNKLTVIELGRLLLSGWYYDIGDWTKEIGEYIHKAYNKIESEGQHFNDLDFQKAVKHIRENIKYYYQNDPELKLYILKTFFNDKLTPLLPPAPEELKQHNEVMDFCKEIRKTAKSKGIDHWINKADNLEGYYFYLQEILEDLGVEDFLSFDDWLKNENSKEDDYWCKIEKIQQEHNAQISNKAKTLNLKNI